MKNIFLVLLLLITGQAFGQVRHLVLDLENVVIQQIPYRNFQSFQQKSEMFQVNNGKYLSFYIHLQAREWLSRMAKRNDVIIHVLSDRDLATSKLILEAIKDARFKNGELFSEVTQKGKVLTLEDKVSGAHDLTKLHSAVGEIIFIGHDSAKIQASQKSRALSMGEDYYKFESWADAKRNYDSAAAADKIHFPASEEEYNRESRKISMLGFIFRSPGFDLNPVTLLTKYDARQVRNQAIGGFELGEKGDKNRTFWNLSSDNKTILGCDTVDLSKDIVIKSSAPAGCIKLLPVVKSWKISADKTRATGCSISSGGAQANLLVDDCLDSDVKTFWKGKTKGMCSYYTEDLVFIADKGAVGCDDQHVILNPNNNQYQAVTYFRGMETKTEKQIFESPPPTAADPFRLYSPYDVNKSIGFTIDDCLDPSYNGHPVKEVGGVLPEKCKPDVLYSWGPKVKIEDYKKVIGDQSSWASSMRKIFASGSPVATFGYGEYAMRLKIKKGVKWVRSGVASCDPANGPVIHYHAWSPGLDYGFCHPDVLESWSYGMPDHYDEIIKDYQWLSNPATPRSQVITYSNGGFQDMLTRNWDSMFFSAAFLRTNLNRHQDLVTKKEGEVFYHPSTPTLLRKESEHFKTRRPIYFNER